MITMQKAPKTPDYDAFAPNEVGFLQPRIQFPLDSIHTLGNRLIKCKPKTIFQSSVIYWPNKLRLLSQTTLNIFPHY
jgi:hypothetical protein